MQSTVFSRFLSLLVLLLSLGSVHAIWPAPLKSSTGTKTLFIAQTLSITYNGGTLPYTYGYAPPPGPTFSSQDIVQAAVSRAFAAIFQQNFVPWKLRAKNSNFEPDLFAGRVWVQNLEIVQTGVDAPGIFKAKAGEVDESYTLTLSEEGVAKLTAESSVGVLRGLETFVQLFYQHTSGGAWYTPYAPVSIEDAPRYPHRGLLLDTARHFYPVKDILKVIDALAMNKMNRLHIHVTDSQSWPLDIPSMPDLSKKGAYATGLSYSPADVANIHEYALHRGIEVIMEIDMPGHIGSVAFAYPELIVAYNEQPYYWWCLEPPCGAFKLNSTAVDDFLENLFNDLLPRLAPYTSYFHTGGDEINRNDSMLDEGVRSNDTAVLQPLLQKFVDANHARVRKAGLTPMIWEEIALEWNVTIGKDVVVQTWLGSASVKQLTGRGQKIIDSNYEYWYLDCGRGQWLNFDNGAAFSTFFPFNDWCSPAKGWRLMYSYDPAGGLTAEAAKNVLGGEVAVWTETIDPVNFDVVVWPRAGAAAEVLWSGRIDPATGQNRSQYDAAPRLADMRERMVARGIGAAPVQMTFCTQSDPEYCAYPL